MDKIRIVYIDDNVDVYLSEYLEKEYNHDNFLYKEISFNSEDGYDCLIDDPRIKEANIVIIDSKLFENDRAVNGKFTGEEFKMILKKIFPFIEVIVITQNELDEDYGTLSKYRGDCGDTFQKYYAMNLKAVLDDSIKNINVYRNIVNKLKNNDGIDKVLIEKITSSLEGLSQYDELTTRDIDNIINAFKEIQEEVDEK